MNVINLARKRKVVPHYYAPQELEVICEDKFYNVYGVSNDTEEGYLKFLIKNEKEELIWIEEFSVIYVPLKLRKMFKNIEQTTTFMFE